MFMRMPVATILLLRLISGARYFWLASGKPTCVVRLLYSCIPLFGEAKRKGLTGFRVSEAYDRHYMW